jgi:hypothetical protein
VAAVAILLAGCGHGESDKVSPENLPGSGMLLANSLPRDLSGNWREQTPIREDTCGFGAWRGYRDTIFTVAQAGEILAVDSLSIYREPWMTGDGHMDGRRVELHLTRHQLQQPPDCYVDFEESTVATLGSDEIHGQQVVTYTARGHCNLSEFIPTGNNPCQLLGEFHLWKCVPGECFEGQILLKPVPRSDRRLDKSIF